MGEGSGETLCHDIFTLQSCSAYSHYFSGG